MSIEVMVCGGPLNGRKLTGAKFVRLSSDITEPPDRLVVVGKHVQEPTDGYTGGHYARRGRTAISDRARYEWQDR